MEKNGAGPRAVEEMRPAALAKASLNNGLQGIQEHASAPDEDKLLHKKQLRHSTRSLKEAIKVIQLAPINGCYCTPLEDAAVLPQSPCECPVQLLSAPQTDGAQPVFEFKLKRRNCFKAKNRGERARRAGKGGNRQRRASADDVSHAHNNEERGGRPKRMLFCAALIITNNKRLVDGISKRTPEVSYSYGEIKEESFTNVANLLYPDSENIAEEKTGKCLDFADHSFFQILTDQFGMRTYAYCIKFAPESDENEYFLPSVFALLSPHHDTSFFFDLVLNATCCLDNAGRLTAYLDRLNEQPYITKRQLLIVGLMEGNSRNEEELSSVARESKMRKSWSIDDVVRKMTPEWTTCVIAALLNEKRVIITGSTVAEVSRVCYSLEALLRPFEWPFVFIPCLPANLTDFCESPSPYLIGVQRIHLDKLRNLVVECTIDGEYTDSKDQCDFAMFDIDRGLINPIPISSKNNNHYEKNGTGSLKYANEETQMRVKNSYLLCAKYDTPRKVCKRLTRLLHAGLEKGGTAYGLDASTEAMLHWYASIFGHYKSAGMQSQWDTSTKAVLVESQLNPTKRLFLQRLVESEMFTQWLDKKVNKPPSVTITQLLGASQRDAVLLMQHVLLSLETSSARQPLWKSEMLEGVNTKEESDDITDFLFDRVATTVHAHRKSPVKHAFGKLFGSSAGKVKL